MKDQIGLPNTEGGKWALPGGFVRMGETAYEAARRELKQETGVSGFHIKHFNVYDQPNRDSRGWMVTNAFYAIVKESLLQERKAQDVIAEVELFTIPEALDLELAFDHRVIIIRCSKSANKRNDANDNSEEIFTKRIYYFGITAGFINRSKPS